MMAGPWPGFGVVLCSPSRRTPGFGPRAREPSHDCLLAGLLSGVERKNGWQLAEVNGATDPYGIQYLLNRALVGGSGPDRPVRWGSSTRLCS